MELQRPASPLRYVFSTTGNGVRRDAHSRLGVSAPTLLRRSVHSPPLWWAVFPGAVLLVCATLFSSASRGSSPSILEYQYDDLNRLVQVVLNDQVTAIRYRYDEVSNIEWIATGDSPDTDGDGIPNFADHDDDDDGIPDVVEIAAGLDALDAAGPMGAAGDLDNDGITNLDEYLQGSDINHYHGDLDGDDDLDLGDIVVLKRIVFGQAVATPEQAESGHGDVNMDGYLDVGDLVILKGLYFE